MKWFWGTVWTAILGAAGALLVVVFQDPLKDALDGTEYVAEVYISPWQPYPRETGNSPKQRLSGTLVPDYHADSLTEGGSMPMAMIALSNNDIKDASDIRITFGRSFSPDVLVVQEGDIARRSLDDAREVRIETIAANGKAFVYVWNNYDLASGYNLEGMRIFTPSKEFVIKTYAYDDVDRRLYNEPQWYSWLESGIPIFLFLCLGFLLFVGFALAIFLEAYVKKLLGDHDFYLVEGSRYEDDPKGFKPDYEKVKL